MARYGFRLFEVRVHEGQGRKPKRFESCGDQHYVDIAAAALKNLTGLRRYDDPPREGQDDLEDTVPRSRALVIDEVAVQGKSLLINFHAGATRDHDKALGMSEEVDDVDLEGRAPSHAFRAILALPARGDLGVLAVEDVARGCPRDMLVKWLNAEANREALRNDTTPWRITIKPMTDPDQIRAMERKTVQSIEFRKHGRNADGTPSETGMKVTVTSGVSRSAIAGIKAKGKEWIEDKISGRERVTDKQAARDLAVLVGDNLDLLDFDDAWFVLADDNVSPSKISPSRAGDVFVYRIADTAPTDKAFAQATKPKARTLARARDVSLNWPDW